MAASAAFASSDAAEGCIATRSPWFQPRLSESKVEIVAPKYEAAARDLTCPGLHATDLLKDANRI